MKSRRGSQRNGVNKKKNLAGNFIFWMTTIGLSLAAFFALLAITTIAINIVTTRIVMTWYVPARAAPPTPNERNADQFPLRPFTTFQMHGYSFDNPGNWRAQAKLSAVQLYPGNRNDHSNLLAVPSSQVAFFSSDGMPVAEIRCPIQDTGTGYELANASVESRQFERNGFMYSAVLRLGQVNTQKPWTGQFALILIQPANNVVGYEASCQINSPKWGVVDLDRESFRRIFQSLR